MILASALIVAAAILWAGWRIGGRSGATPPANANGRALDIVALFAPGIAAADRDPRALLVWQPLARIARQICPEEFVLLDRAAGSTFPFDTERLESAHAHWSAEWLAWERTHDAEYKLKAAALEDELAASGGSPIVRARLENVEREKLDVYQRRYEEYIRTAKALERLAR